LANEVSISVTAEDTGAKATMESTAQSGDKLSGSVKRVGETAGGVLAANTITNLSKQVTGFMTATVAAGDQVDKASARLGVSAKAYQELDFWASQNGISQGALEGAVRTLNQRIGEATEGNQQYADAFQALGVDIETSSGQIRDTEDVLTDVIGKLRDIDDPARQAALAAELFGRRMGAQLLPALRDTSLSLEDAAKRAAELGIVMDQDAIDASVKFADTLDELKRAGQAVVRDLIMPMVSAFADHLLPVMVDITAGFRSLPGPVTAVAVGVAALSAAALLVAPRVLAARSALIAFGLSATAANRALGAIGLAITIIGVAVAAFGDAQGKGASMVDELTASMDKQTGALSSQTREIIASRLEHDGLLKSAQSLGIGLEDLTDIILSGEDAQRQMIDAINATGVATLGADGAFTDFKDSTKDQRVAIISLMDGLSELAPQVTAAQGGWERQREAVDGATEANYEQIDSLQSLADELRAQVDPAFKLIKAQEDLAEAQKAVTEAERDHGKKSPEYRAALRDEAKAALDVLSAAGELGDEFTGDLSKAQRKMLEDAGISEAAIERLAADLRKAKKDADRLDGTRVRINEEHTITTTRINREITERHGVNAPTLRAHGGVTGAEVSSAQTGGVRRGMTIVGEAGPELVELPVGSTVIPAGATRNMLNGSGGGPTEVVVRLEFVGADEEFAEFFRRIVRRRPGLVAA
jgi:hypothetical protein